MEHLQNGRRRWEDDEVRRNISSRRRPERRSFSESLADVLAGDGGGH
jgi:hypothetical protein